MVKAFLKVMVSLMLLVNGVGAIAAGWSFIVEPDGSGIGLPLSYLEHSPFEDYLIPGLILFTVNGLFSIWTLMTLLFKWSSYPYYVIAQGAILTGWIAIQVAMVRDFNVLHLVMGLIGLSLISCGFLLRWIQLRNIRRRPFSFLSV